MSTNIQITKRNLEHIYKIEDQTSGGLCHAFKGDKPCSKRTKCMKEKVDSAQSKCISQSPTLKGIGTTLKVTNDDITKFKEYIKQKKKKNCDSIFFSGKKQLDLDAHIHSGCDNATLVGLIDDSQHDTGIKIYDDAAINNGGISCINKDTNDLVFILVPRKTVCGKGNIPMFQKPSQFLKALDAVEGTRSNLHGSRGSQRKLVFEQTNCNQNYQNLFVQADRGGKGLILNFPQELRNTENQKAIEKWKRYIHSIVDSYVPKGMLKGIRSAIVEIGLDTRSVRPKRLRKDLEEGEVCDTQNEYLVKNKIDFDTSPKIDMLPTLAMSRNVALSLHKDHDASLSAVAVYRHEDVCQRKGTFHRRRSPILKYFTFGCGISIGLRSGDVLIFNPQIDHCISTNTEECRQSGVMTTSHYYKTSVIGLNDNDIPFSK